MRRRTRHLATAAAAVTAATLPLWASPAGAGAPNDEEHQSVRTVNVNGVDCQIRLSSFRYTTGVYGRTEVLTAADQCRTNQVSVTAEFRSEHGDTVSASSAVVGPMAEVAGGGASDLIRTFHGVTFTFGPSVSYTMASK